MHFIEKNGPVKIIIKLAPGSSSNQLVSLEKDLLGDTILKVSVTAIPEKGQANKALFKLLSKSLKLPKSAFNIIRGELSRTKIFSIECSAIDLLEKFKAVGLV